MPTEDPSPNLSPGEAVDHLKRRHSLNVTVGTLSGWRFKGGGPRFLKNGQNRALYPQNELDTWATNRLGQLRDKTSDHKDTNP